MLSGSAFLAHISSGSQFLSHMSSGSAFLSHLSSGFHIFRTFPLVQNLFRTFPWVCHFVRTLPGAQHFFRTFPQVHNFFCIFSRVSHFVRTFPRVFHSFHTFPRDGRIALGMGAGPALIVVRVDAGLVQMFLPSKCRVAQECVLGWRFLLPDMAGFSPFENHLCQVGFCRWRDQCKYFPQPCAGRLRVVCWAGAFCCLTWRGFHHLKITCARWVFVDGGTRPGTCASNVQSGRRTFANSSWNGRRGRE